MEPAATVVTVDEPVAVATSEVVAEPALARLDSAATAPRTVAAGELPELGPPSSPTRART